MPVDRSQDRYGGRFARDTTESGVLEGYQRAVQKLDRDLVRRNIEPYKKYGFEQSLKELGSMTDAQRFSAATRAVIAKYLAGKKGEKADKGGGGSKGGGTAPKAPSKPKAPVKPRKPAKAPRKAVKPTKPRKQPKAQHKPPRQVQRLPPKGAAKPVQHLPPKPRQNLPPKPAPKKPPVIRPSGSGMRMV